MREVFLNLIRSLFGGLSPRLDLDCGGSDSDSGGCSDCGGSDSDSGDSSKGIEGAGSSAEVSSDVTESSDSSGSSSDRRTRDAGLVGGTAAGAAIAHHRRKKGQRNANDATDEDLANIPRCQREQCQRNGRCDCDDDGKPYGDRPVRIRLRKR